MQMYRGGKICLTVHFKPLWAKNFPRFGIAHTLCLGLALWLALKVPILVDSGMVKHKDGEIIVYNPVVQFFLFLVQWVDCSLAGAVGLLRILIYKVYVDGTTTMSTHERKANIREFYGAQDLSRAPSSTSPESIHVDFQYRGLVAATLADLEPFMLQPEGEQCLLQED
ncbi:hypothetical protein GUJ93_ZPchr0010g8140 [Zizania palustris]|uniref:Ubiquitin-fold modifier-conjugating enzyme 1 n=1 Tax=Zizania palustris TaxID=103762 RepID=A0A8J6BQL4_ZIZPA|nr:hypothetical protein GUJ93_ZPchr0010g8140 [Zizania palustris]